MTFIKIAAPVVLALSLCLSLSLSLCLSLSLSLLFAAPARAAEDASRFLLTPALMQQLKAAESDMKAAQKAQTEDAPETAEAAEPTIESTIARLEKDPSTRAILAKHGLTTRELVLASFAMLHAGMYISIEKTVDQAKGAELYTRYTTEQKANIALIRAMVTAKQK